MTRRRSFTLLEVMLAAALLALVVVACLPMVSSNAAAPKRTPDPRLSAFVGAGEDAAPPNARIDRFPSSVGAEIKGDWVVVSVGDRFAVVWVAERPRPTEGNP